MPIHFIWADVGRSFLTEEFISHIEEVVPHSTKGRVAGAGECDVPSDFLTLPLSSLISLAGHLVVQDDPKGTAKEIAEALRRSYPVKGVGRL